MQNSKKNIKNAAAPDSLPAGAIRICDFFRVDGCNYASYDNYRKIASVVDGLKPSSRKCLYVVLKNRVVSPKKVSQLKSDVASQTQYLHGEQSLEGVIVGMAQDFPGSNNLPLFKRHGMFGNRLKQDAAAGRYIFTCAEDYLDKLFVPADSMVIPKQFFEGEEIEPKYFEPVIPLLLANGAVGLTSGFYQKILPRDPLALCGWLERRLSGKDPGPCPPPYFRGFSGDVSPNFSKPDGGRSWVISGRFARSAADKSVVMVEEVPVGYDLESYVSKLNALCDSKDLSDYQDLSDAGVFKFKVWLPKGSVLSDPELEELLGLKQSVTENYTSFTADNKVMEFSSAQELLEEYYAVRLQSYADRKEALLRSMSEDLVVAVSKRNFIRAVADGTIVLSRKTQSEIVSQLESAGDISPDKSGSYDYLVELPLKSLSVKNIEALEKRSADLEKQIADLEKQSPAALWKSDLSAFKKVLAAAGN